MKEIKDIMINMGCADVGILKYSDCDCINPHLEAKMDFKPASILIGTVPYYTVHCDKDRTVSAYAVAYDYHKLLFDIGTAIINKSSQLFPHAKFAFYGDRSPINEKIAAAKAGLGLIGRNSLLITPKHSSYVFLFEIFTDIECDAEPKEIRYCENCLKCVKACPGFLKGKSECLSAITQKKGNLTEDEKQIISAYRTIWGCDICQEVCPHTIKAKQDGTLYTDHSWFNYNINLTPTQESISNSNDFLNRAYSWRGEKTIVRNLLILDKNETNEKGS